MVTYFISGHRTISDEEFQEHYAKAIDKGIEECAMFVVGEYYGVDRMAIDYLRKKNYEDVRVFHMFESPRYNAGFLTVGGFIEDESRDAAMTDNSSSDIAWVRPGKEASGTAQNLMRRKVRTMLSIVESVYFECRNISKDGCHEKHAKMFFNIKKAIREEWQSVSGEYIEERE